MNLKKSLFNRQNQFAGGNEVNSDLYIRKGFAKVIRRQMPSEADPGLRIACRIIKCANRSGRKMVERKPLRLQLHF